MTLNVAVDVVIKNSFMHVLTFRFLREMHLIGKQLRYRVAAIKNVKPSYRGETTPELHLGVSFVVRKTGALTSIAKQLASV